ncbi:hypothetical protein CLAFUR0_04174 [Fulvia fulva]|nr:hypothetical protein CLAFUR0_04174 [Fulvia fulva]
MASLFSKLKNPFPSARHSAMPPIGLYSQDALALVKRHLAWLNTPTSQWSPKRTQALSAYKAWIQQHQVVNDLLRVPSAMSMCHLIRILDDLVFDSTILHYFQFGWRELNNGRSGQTIALYSVRMALIEMDPTLLGQGRLLNSVVSTLLHEMCHAYLFLFSCQGVFCGRRSCLEGSRRYNKEIGRTGHGAAWEQLAWAVEDFGNGLKVLRVNLTVAYAVSFEDEKLKAQEQAVGL